MSKQLIDTPQSQPGGMSYEQLAYMDVRDGVLGVDYAFVAYKETDSWGWRVRINSSQTAGAVFEPAAMAQNARGGVESFRWGYSFDPSPSDPRDINFVVHCSNDEPESITMNAILRQADGSVGPAKSVTFAWPGSLKAAAAERKKQLIETPQSQPGGMSYEQLAYMDVYDAVLRIDYAFVAFKETDSWGWRVRINSSQTAGAVFEPAAMAQNAKGAKSFRWGYSFDPSPSDPRDINFVVNCSAEKPESITMNVTLRQADGSAGPAKSVTFAWPA